MSYRVETASSGRAGCQATECKKAGLKIDKDDLRFGVWVDFQDRGSWQWRHWGCVSGKQLQNMRNYLEDPEKPGTYRWDFLDGYDGEEKSSLAKHPDLQEKVRRVVTQGFIDPDDWNGDPEMNKLGETGLRTAASKKKMREEQKNRALEIEELKEKIVAATTERDELLAAGKSATKVNKRLNKIQKELDDYEAADKLKTPTKKRVKGDVDEDEEEKPAKKKRATKAKKEEDGDGEDVKPTKKARAKKIVKKEDGGGEEAEKPAKKPRAKKAVKNEDDEDIEMPDAAAEENKPTPPLKKPRANKAKKEELQELQTIKNEEVDKPTVAPKKRGPRSKIVKEEDVDEEETVEKKAPSKKGRKRSIKDEPHEDTNLIASATENEHIDNGETRILGHENADLRAEFEDLLDKGEIEDDFEKFVEKSKAPMPKGKGRGGKKGKTSASASDARGSRSRAALKT
ncbi:poly polymerase and DNA-ligase Zn-finger region-domain-containing protein [Tricladium varicosporioides]|nr:poly polymerase and DNA-ligase Zn-finger region-domain-containing protein [Hymenoscyphus varicosporioides]